MDNLANWVNQEILNLWMKSKFKEDGSVLMPLIYSNIKKSVLLFVSLNPSFTERGIEKLLEKSPYSVKDVIDSLTKWQSMDNFNIAIEFEKLSRKEGKFFNRFREIAECADIDWEHVDLFFYRMTRQEDFLKKIYMNKKRKDMTEFGKCQLDLSKKLIWEINPIAIVVANATASTIFKNEFNAKFNKEKGYYEIKLSNTTLPVFLGGILNGRCPLDNYSFERLKWHIRQTIKGIKDQ